MQRFSSGQSRRRACREAPVVQYVDAGKWRALNNIQRRLFRAFLRSGGNLLNEGELEAFIRYIEAHLWLLPLKMRAAIDLAWRNESAQSAAIVRELSQREGAAVSPQALRQRLSRGLKVLEALVQQRQWRVSGNGVAAK